jgi:hypothetical protein
MTVLIDGTGLGERLHDALRTSGVIENGDPVTIAHVLEHLTLTGIADEAMAQIAGHLIDSPAGGMDHATYMALREAIREEVVGAVVKAYLRHDVMAELAAVTFCGDEEEG